MENEEMRNEMENNEVRETEETPEVSGGIDRGTIALATLMGAAGIGGFLLKAGYDKFGKPIVAKAKAKWSARKKRKEENKKAGEPVDVDFVDLDEVPDKTDDGKEEEQ